MDIPRSEKVSANRAGLSSGNAFKLGAWLITGVAGSLFLGRVLRETIRLGICSVVPLVVYQVLRKPAGCRRVITDQDAANASLHDQESQFQDVVLPERSLAPVSVKLKTQGKEQIDIPVLTGQQSGGNPFQGQDEEDCLSIEESLPVAEERQVFLENKQSSSMSNAEWAAGLLDALEDDSENIDGLECRKDEVVVELVGWGDAWSDESLSDESLSDEPAKGSLAALSDGHNEVGKNETTVREITTVELPEEKEPEAVSPAVADRIEELESNASVLAGTASRESGRISQFSYRRIPLDVSKPEVAHGKSSSFIRAEEFHDAFSSAPFPGPQVPGVKPFENPFTRSDPAAVSVAKPGELASVILQGGRRSRKKIAGGNSMLVRMLVILLIGGGFSYCVFLAKQALRGEADAVRNSSYSITPPLLSPPGNVSETELGKPHGDKKKNVSSSLFSESLASDDHLPSFRSLE